MKTFWLKGKKQSNTSLKVVGASQKTLLTNSASDLS